MQKVRFVWRILQLLLQIGQIMKSARDLYNVYIDRGYGSGPTQITDTDLQVTIPGEGIDLSGMTVAQFNEVAGVLVDILAFFEGTGAPAMKDREAIYNKYRRDI